MDYSHKSLRFLKNIAKKDKITAEIIFKGIEEIKKNPYCCKLLVGNFKGSRSKRKGNYRIIYKIYEEKNMIYIMNVGHRDDVYG